VPFCLESDSAVVMSHGPEWHCQAVSRRNRAIVITNSSLKVSPGIARNAAVVVSHREFAVQRYCLVIVCDRPIDVAFGLEDQTPIVIGAGVTGADSNAPVIVGECLVQFPLVISRVPAIVVSHRECRIECDGSGVVANGAINVALVVQTVSPLPI